MELNDILSKYKLNTNCLEKYGFIKDKDIYKLKKDINDSLYVTFILNEKQFIVDVYNKDDDTLYLPFNVKNNIGSYVSQVREIVNKCVEDIIDKCFIKEKYIDKIYEIVKEKYNIDVEYLFSDDNVSGVLRNDKKKWFLLYMEIEYKKLGVHKDGIANVINIKMDPKDIDELVDNINYFRAYHMNKKHWITVLLNNNIDVDDVMKLIDNSYELVRK